jgi:hypothetical protein
MGGTSRPGLQTHRPGKTDPSGPDYKTVRADSEGDFRWELLKTTNWKWR